MPRADRGGDATDGTGAEPYPPIPLDAARLAASAALGMSFAISDARRPDQPLVWVNSEFERLTGYSAAEAVGRNCRFLQGAGTDRAAVARLRAAIDARRPGREVLRNYREDGSPFDNEVAVSPVVDVDGSVAFLVGTQLDVSERVAAEREREERLGLEREARQRAEDVRDRLRLLNSVADLLTASLDVEHSMPRLVSLVVPSLADWAVLALVREAGEESAPPVVELAAAHADPDRDRVLQDLIVGPPPWFERSRVVREVLRTGRPLLVAEADRAWLRSVADDAGLAATYERLGVTSAVFVPLRARRHVGGALALVRASGTPYDATDLALAAAIGRLAAVVVDNARLQRRQQLVAATLQRALLPRLPELPGLDVAGDYQPGAVDAAVGGDWFDALPTPDGGTVVVVGDVSGHDVPAAAAMGQLRSVLRAYLWEGHGPGAALALLDRLASTSGSDRVASVACAELSAPAPDGSRLLTYAIAGHPPPLVRRVDGAVELLEQGRSPVIGVDLPGQRRTATERLDPGDALVLYTDGVIEQRRVDIDVSVRTLADRLAALPTRVTDSADATAAAVLASRDADAAQDDRTVLVVRLRRSSTGTGTSRAVAERWPADVLVPRRARESVAALLRAHGSRLDEVVCTLLVSETVSNAVEAGAATVVLRAWLRTSSPEELVVEVSDDAAGALPVGVPAMPPATATSGRGLALVERLSGRWGVRQPSTRPGKAVWFAVS